MYGENAVTGIIILLAPYINELQYQSKERKRYKQYFRE